MSAFPPDYSPEQEQPEPEPEPEQKQAPRKDPQGSLIKLGDAEARKLLDRITSAYDDAWQDNQRRIDKFRRYFRAWRNTIGLPGGEQGKPNFRVPLIVEKTLIKWAKTLDALLGDDAEVIAEPTGPVDQSVMHKVGRYMTWQVFNHMDIVEELSKFLFQEIIYGRAHAECYYDVKWLYGEGEQKELLYDGPVFKTLSPDSIVFPPTCGENSPQDFEWVTVRCWYTLDELIRGEDEGYYYGISENAEMIARHALIQPVTDWERDPIKREQAGFEGVVSDYRATDKTTVEVRKHYCRHRMTKSKNADVPLDDYKQRNLRESELVVSYIPDLVINQPGMQKGLIIGVQNLAELFPHTPNRRPIVTASLFKDGSYWCPGFPELLEQIEYEKTVNHNLMNQAGELSVAPPGFYIPGLGMTEERQKLEPGMLYASSDPKAIQFMKFEGDYQFCVIRDQMLTALAEGVSGLSAASVGRSPDTPNAPRTFRGQALLQGQSDIRQSLETHFMEDDWSKILDHIKMLVDEYGPPGEEFRVTEEDASGYFETQNGFAQITAEERQGKYDFRLKFATSSQSREARKERELAFAQVAAAMPLFLQNTNLQRDLLVTMAKDLEIEGILPSLAMIADQNTPIDPRTEWVQMLQGIEPHIHPQDDDDAHLQQHYSDLNREMQKPPEKRDKQAVNFGIAHMMEHEEQKRQKMQMLMQQQAVANAQAALGMMGGGEGGGGGQANALQAPGPVAGLGGPGVPNGAGMLGQVGAGFGNGSEGMGPGQQMAGFPGQMSPAEATGGY